MSNELFGCLPLLSQNVPLSCVWRLRSIPNGRQMKTDYIYFIRNDFVQQTNEPIQLSTPDRVQGGADKKLDSSECFAYISLFYC